MCVSAREEQRINAGSPGSNWISYIAVLFSSVMAWGVEAVKGPVCSRLGALVHRQCQRIQSVLYNHTASVYYCFCSSKALSSFFSTGGDDYLLSHSTTIFQFLLQPLQRSLDGT